MMRSLQTRLLVAIGALALASLAVAALAVRQGTRQEFLRFQEIERRSEAARAPDLAKAVARDLEGRCCAGIGDVGQRLPRDTALLVTDADRGSLVASTGRALENVEIVGTRRDGRELTVDAERRRGGLVDRIGLRLALDGVPLHLADGRAAVLYVVPFPRADRERNVAAFLGSLDRHLLAVTVLVACAALVVTWVLARGIVRPLRDLQAAARDLGRGDFGRRVVPSGSRELVDVGVAFNAMASELERQQALRRGVVSDVAHELRTPLTALRCRLETVLDGLAPDPAIAVRDLHEEVLHLGRLVDDLQELALAEARELRLRSEDVPLNDVVQSAIKAAGLEHDARLRVESTPGLMARGDVSRIRQVALNLLTNADRYAPAGGTIVVRTSADGDRAILDVRNTGSRLDGEQIARLFDRFYRTDPSRQRVTGGTGLGLAIVKHLVEAQGGSVWARSEDDGVTIGVALPRAGG